MFFSNHLKQNSSLEWGRNFTKDNFSNWIKIVSSEYSANGKLVVWVYGIPLWRDCCLMVPRFESRTTNPNHQFTISWGIEYQKRYIHLPETKIAPVRFPVSSREDIPWKSKLISLLNGSSVFRRHCFFVMVYFTNNSKGSFNDRLDSLERFF